MRVLSLVAMVVLVCSGCTTSGYNPSYIILQGEEPALETQEGDALNPSRMPPLNIEE